VGATDHGALTGLGDDDHPQYLLAGVRDAADGFAVTGTLGSGAIPATGAGTRIMWYPGKAAFRAGSASGTQWDGASIGDYSVAMGESTIASATQSTAMGRQATASGDYSVAMGNSTTASSNSSTAMGDYTTASGAISTAMGNATTASGGSSTAMGGYTTASGGFSMAAGNGTTAQAYGSLAIGQYNVAAGSPSSWVDTDPLLVAGNGASPSSPSNALTLNKRGDLEVAGTFTAQAALLATGALGSGAIPATGAGTRLVWYPGKAAFRAGRVLGAGWDDANVGTYSTAIAYNTTASGDLSMAMGNSTTASGTGSMSMGYNTTASGIYSMAMGQNAIASGNTSKAMGVSATASGEYSTAIGVSVTASGAVSTAIGQQTTSQAYGSLAIGRYNVIAGSSSSWVSSDPLFVAGNGSSAASSSNALTLLKNGNLTIAGTLTQNSDIRLKEDVEPVVRALDDLLGLTPIRYRFREETGHPTERQIGLSAQQVRDFFPELVSEDAEGNLSVAYANLSALLIRALQEQQEEIEALREDGASRQRQIDELRAEIGRLRAAPGSVR